jgi:hypothetical protein
MHDDYISGRLHSESPVADPAAAQVLADAEALFEEVYGERWPGHAVVQIGGTAVLWCTRYKRPDESGEPTLLIDVSLDRLQEQPAIHSHVLFRAWLKSEAAVEFVHNSVERFTKQAWMVEEFSPGEWVQTLQNMARDALLSSQEPGEHWNDDGGGADEKGRSARS